MRELNFSQILGWYGPGGVNFFQHFDEDTKGAKFVLETAKDGIKTIYKALKLYSRLQERILPWKEFNKTIIQMNKYRQNYSTESVELIDEIKGFMLSGKDAYFEASRYVYEWAGLVSPLLTSYVSLFKLSTETNARTQRDILLEVLDNGILKLTASQDELYKSSTNFNAAAGKLIALHNRFGFEFQEHSDFFQSKIKKMRFGAYLSGAYLFGIPGIAIAYSITEHHHVPQLMRKLRLIEKFYDRLKSKVDQAAKDIDKAKRILNNEIQHIGEIKVKTQEVKTFVQLDEEEALRDTVIRSAQKLITKCEEYRERHIEKVQKKRKVKRTRNSKY